MNIDKDFLRIAMDNLSEAHPSVRDYVELLESEIRKLQGENSHWLRNIQYLSQRLAFAGGRAQELEIKHGEAAAWDWHADISSNFSAEPDESN